jgi:hypothetical protein
MRSPFSYFDVLLRALVVGTGYRRRDELDGVCISFASVLLIFCMHVYVVLSCSCFLWIPSLYKYTSQYSYRVDYYAIMHLLYIFSKFASEYCILELAEFLAL